MWGAVIAAGASIIGGAMSGDAAKDASNTQADAAREAAATNLKMYHETADRLQPWVSVGGDALRRLSVLTGTRRHAAGDMTGRPDDRYTLEDFKDYNRRAAPPGYGMGDVDAGIQYTKYQGGGNDKVTADEWKSAGFRELMGPGDANSTDEGYGSLIKDFSLEDFEKDPSYQFRMEEGEKALTRGAASRGMAMSTPGLKDLMRFNQGLASTEYGAAYTRDAANKQRTFDYLSYLSGSGQNAAAMVGNAGTNAASSSAMLTAQAGQMAGQGQFNSAALTANGISTGVGNYMYQKRYDDMMSRMPVFASTPGLVSGMPGQFSTENRQYGG